MAQPASAKISSANITVQENTQNQITTLIEETARDNSSDAKIYGIPAERKILYQSVSLFLSVIVLYITFALFQYSWKKSACRSRKRRSSSSSKLDANRRRTTTNNSGTSDSSTSTSHAVGRSKAVAARNSNILRIMCLIASVLTLSRLVSEQIEILPAADGRVDCRHYQIAMVITYALSISTLYSVLWYRVRVFLSHPAMRHLGSKVLTVLAFVALFIIIVAAILNTVLFLATTVSIDDHGGCQVISPENILSNNARFAFLTISTVLSQASLLGLFLYPLVRHSAAMKTAKATTPQKPKSGSVKSEITKLRATTDATPMSPATLSSTWRRRNSTRRKKREVALMKIIKRVMLTAAVCAVSDIVSGLVVRLVRHEPRIVTNLIFDVNLLVNLASVLMSFKDWKLRIFPCCTNSNRTHQESDTGTIRRRIVKDNKKAYSGPAFVSSPAVCSSHDSSGTQGMYPTSDSGVISASPKERRSGFDSVKEGLAEIGSEDELGKPA